MPNTDKRPRCAVTNNLAHLRDDRQAATGPLPCFRSPKLSVAAGDGM